MPSGEIVALEERIEIANPQHPHCATVLLVDTSSSMAGDKIRQLNDGLTYFRDDVMSDDLARKRVEVAGIGTVGLTSVATRRPDRIRAAKADWRDFGRSGISV